MKTVHPKVAAGGASGAAVTLILYAGTLIHVTLPETVAAAIVVLVTFAAGYLTPGPKKG